VKGNTQVVPSVVRQGFGTRLLRLTSDPGKFRGLPWTVTNSRASTVALEEMEEEVHEYVYGVEDPPTKPPKSAYFLFMK